MKFIGVLIFSFFYFITIGQKSFNPKNLEGKAIYFLKIVDKFNMEGTKTSFNGPIIYPYLLKIKFEKNNRYSITNKYRESSTRGAYDATPKVITLIDGSSKTKTEYLIDYYFDKYITLVSGDKTYYCFVD